MFVVVSVAFLPQRVTIVKTVSGFSVVAVVPVTTVSPSGLSESAVATAALPPSYGSLSVKGVLVPTNIVAISPASSPHSASPSKISELVEHKNRCINAHPALPPHVVPFVEVVGSRDTSQEILNKALNIYKKANYAAILVKKETEGFVLNRLQGALLNEAVRLHEGGFASMEDIDIALKHALGIRWAFMGPFEIMDLNAPEGIKDSFSRYRTGIQNLAKQQNTVPSYSDEYLNNLDKEQRQRLAYHERPDRIKKRNKMIALIRKLKLELGEDI